MNKDIFAPLVKLESLERFKLTVTFTANVNFHQLTKFSLYLLLSAL